MNIKDKHASYEQARRRNLLTTTTVRIFGVPLQARASDGYIPIWWCGIGLDGAEHRKTTYRIWYLPEADIVESGKAEGFSFEGHRVHWYDVKRDCTPVEESFSPVSLAHSARLVLGNRFEGAPRWWFGPAEWWFDREQVPVTLDPTAGPTGTKVPTTIKP